MEEIKRKEIELNVAKDKALLSDLDKDWHDFNTKMNEFGKAIEKFGRQKYNINKKIEIILKLSE
ncbi:MAG: hypothetical protein KYX68_00080 [Flavobacterium sp.]|nr:hypothetical protein [Flavobacterium sp.]